MSFLKKLHGATDAIIGIIPAALGYILGLLWISFYAGWLWGSATPKTRGEYKAYYEEISRGRKDS